MKQFSKEVIEEIFYKMLLIRKFEETILELFSKGVLSGTTHCCIGQEADGVAVMRQLNSEDRIFSNHRCHGHYIARTDDVVGLMAELMGKAGGVCGGRGGSQHLCKAGFFTNGIQGSILPVSAGVAFSQKARGLDAVTVVFIGDGTFGEGAVYESMNLISLKQLPVLVVVENNFYAQSTPIQINLAGTIADRIKAFSISYSDHRSHDALQLCLEFEEIIKKVRNDKKPHVAIVETYRHCPHSKGDDYRDALEIDSWKKKDPLEKLSHELDKAHRESILNKVHERIKEAIETSEKMEVSKLQAGERACE